MKSATKRDGGVRACTTADGYGSIFQFHCIMQAWSTRVSRLRDEAWSIGAMMSATEGDSCGRGSVTVGGYGHRC